MYASHSVIGSPNSSFIVSELLITFVHLVMTERSYLVSVWLSAFFYYSTCSEDFGRSASLPSWEGIIEVLAKAQEQK